METMITAAGLSKCYRIGRLENQADTLMGSVLQTIGKPLENYRRLKSLTDFAGEQGEDQLWALRELSFSVGRGEVVGIIGSNGAGKSTLLKILSRITYPTSGVVQIRGRVASLLEVGTGFHPELTGRENVYLNGTILGMKKAEIDRKFDQIIDFAEVGGFIDTAVKRYSSGMGVRLAFAVAAHLEPEIMLVDEVLAVGDSAFKKKSLGKMGEVAQGGRTVLFVSHDLTSIAQLCTSAILLEGGRIARTGSPAEVIQHYTADLDFGCQLTWDPQTAPGNEKLRLNAIALQDQDGASRSVFDLSEGIQVVMDFSVHAAETRVNPVVRVKNAAGMIVFTTANYAEEHWGMRDYPPGSYQARCAIPGHVLNEGLYAVDVLLVENTRYPTARVDGQLGFSILDGGEQRGDYCGQWLGLIRPQCEWQTSRIGSLTS